MAEARTLHVRIMENGDGSGESQERQVESHGEVWIGARRALLELSFPLTRRVCSGREARAGS